MMIAAHGIALTRGPSSASRAARSPPIAAAKAPSPIGALSPTTAATQPAIDHDRAAVARRSTRGRRRWRPPAPGGSSCECAAPAPRRPTAPTSAMRRRSWRPRPSIRVRRARLPPSSLFATMPTALSGERLPAFAPLATISADQERLDRRGRAPIAKASGAISATLGIAPGPAVDIAQAAIANISGGSSRDASSRERGQPGRQCADRAVRSRPARTAASPRRASRTVRWGSRRHRFRRPAADERADRPRERHRHHADVQSRRDS